MAITLRRKSAKPTASPHGPVVTRLADCHVQIRAHLAEALGLAGGAGSFEARRASASAVAAYFGRALPLHAEDEDRSIAPLLGAEHGPLLDGLARDHADAEACLAQLVPTWLRWSRGEAAPVTAAHRALVTQLDDLLRAHLALEEAELFGAIDALAPELAARVLAEMQARRA